MLDYLVYVSSLCKLYKLKCNNTLLMFGVFTMPLCNSIFIYLFQLFISCDLASKYYVFFVI